MRLTYPLSLAAIASLWTLGLPAQDHPSHLQQIVAANSLTLPGKSPFHLKLAFQLYSLEGKPTDTGTIEQWWAATGSTKTLITANSLNSPDAVPFDNDLKIDPRERYLLDRLLQAELEPISSYDAAKFGNLNETSRTFGKATLTCLSIPVSDPAASGRSPETFCADPKSNALRIQAEAGLSATVRNSVGTFNGTTVSLDLQISYAQRLAITGKVTTLQAFDPANSTVVLPAPPTPGGGQEGGVIAGKVLHKVAPAYPEFARMNHKFGAVLLHALVSRQGTVTNIVPIASPDAALTASAIEAVKQWTYQPYLLNGQPVEVDANIQINFDVH